MNLRAATALLLALPACTFLMGTDATQCSTDADCRARGAAFASAVCTQHVCRSPDESRWTCLDQPRQTPATGPATVRATMDLYDAVRNDPLPQLSVRACARLDVTCAKPLTAAVESNNAGRVTIELPAAFDGYLEITGRTTMPAIWFFSPPPVEDGTYGVGLLSPTSFAEIAKTVGATIDATKGHTFHFALDCAATYGTFAPGVSFQVEPAGDATRSFYLAGGLPNTAATQTDTSGVGGFANLSPGVVTVKANVASTGRAAGSTSVLVRAGCITYAPVAP